MLPGLRTEVKDSYAIVMTFLASELAQAIIPLNIVTLEVGKRSEPFHIFRTDGVICAVIAKIPAC